MIHNHLTVSLTVLLTVLLTALKWVSGAGAQREGGTLCQPKTPVWIPVRIHMWIHVWIPWPLMIQPMLLPMLPMLPIPMVVVVVVVVASVLGWVGWWVDGERETAVALPVISTVWWRGRVW